MKLKLFSVLLSVPTLVYADTISINNLTESSIYGAFQSSTMTGVAADSVNGIIKPGLDHVYFESDGFFQAGSVNIKVGDTITAISVFDITKNEYVQCAENVLFRGAMTFDYVGDACVVSDSRFSYSTSEAFSVRVEGGSQGGASARKEWVPEPPLNEYIGFRAIYDVTYEHTGAADESQYNVSTFLYSNPWVTQERQNRGYLKQDLANSFDFHAPLGGAKFWVESNGDVELRGIPGGIEYSIQHLNTNKNIPAYNSDTESWNYNIASFADVRIELFNPVMTEKEGFIGDSGEWHRPNFDYYTGEDKGRTEQTVPYTSLEFTVNASGVYGFKTANKLPSGGMTVRSVLYVFDGKPKEVGDYDNLLAEHSQGHIAGVYLEKGKTYYLVNSDDFASSDAKFLLFVGGPDNVVFK